MYWACNEPGMYVAVCTSIVICHGVSLLTSIKLTMLSFVALPVIAFPDFHLLSETEWLQVTSFLGLIHY